MKLLLSTIIVFLLGNSKYYYANGFSTILSTRSTFAPPMHHHPTSTPQSSSRLSSCLMTMHMGHSHSHHHHHEHHDKSTPLPASQEQPRRRRNRLAVMLSFVVLSLSGMILGTTTRTTRPLWWMNRMKRTDLMAFLLLSSVLVPFLGSLKREVARIVTKLQLVRQGIVKHTTPIKKGTLHKFLFRNDNAADRVTLLGGIVNILLSCGKFVVGVKCHSSALVADAGHSLSDLFSDVITLGATQVARLPPDEDHPYGHGKFEAIGSLFLGMTLVGTGLSVGAMALSTFAKVLSNAASSAASTAATAAAFQIPTLPAFIMAALSIVSKEWLYRITKKVGLEINSQLVIANAWHHRSDAYSSILACGAIGLAMISPNLQSADSAAGMLVAGMICVTGMEIMSESIQQLTDTSNTALVTQVEDVILSQQDEKGGGGGGSIKLERVRARQVGSTGAIADVTVTTEGDLSSSACRTIEERLRNQILQQVDGVHEAEVHAKTQQVVCPLLLEVDHNHKKSTDPCLVEQETKRLLMENQQQQQQDHSSCLYEVVGITVHYEDSSLLASVDVDISFKKQNEGGITTLEQARQVAQQLREKAESSDQIEKARIYLDLNHHQHQEEENQTVEQPQSIEKQQQQ